MLGMHPIFTLFGTQPDMSTASGAASYTRQLTEMAGLHVMLTYPGHKTPWDTRTAKEKENDKIAWDQLRANNPERNLPADMGGFYLASNEHTRVRKLLVSAYKMIDVEVAERDYLRNRRDMATYQQEAATGQDLGLGDARRAELNEVYAKAQQDVQDLTTDKGNTSRKGTKNASLYEQAQRLIQAVPLSGQENDRLAALEKTYVAPHPNLAVEVGSSNVAVVDCDTAAELEWFQQWAAQQSGDDHWLNTLPTVKSPGVFDEASGQWKHRNGGHFWFSITDVEGESTPAGLTISPIPETITKVHVRKPDSDVQFTIMVNKSYVLIPPSVRKEGAYQAAGPSHSMPGWLYDHIITDSIDKQEKAAERARERAEREGLSMEQVEELEQWWVENSWESILLPLGWTRYGDDSSCGCPVFSRPGFTNPKSATAHVRGCSNPKYADSMDPPIHFWTDNPGPEIADMVGEVGSNSTLSKLQLTAAVRHGGDMSGALKSAVSTGTGDSSHYEVMSVSPGVAMVATLQGDGGEDDSFDPAALPTAQVDSKPQDSAQQEPQPFVFEGDDLTYDAAPGEEEEAPLPAPVLPADKGEIPVYKTEGIIDDPVIVRDLEWLKRHRPPVKFLIRDWIQENTVSMIYGPSNAGKTAVVLDMLCTMAAHSEPYESDYTMWLDAKAKRRNILYVAGEGTDGVVNRVAAWEKKHGRSVQDHMIFKEDAFKFLSPESSWYALGERIKQNNIDIVVFDTLAMMMTGMEENSNDDMGRVVAWLHNLQRHTGSTVLLIHHTTKSTENVTARGASALMGAVASAVLVQKRDMETLDEDTRDSFEREFISPIRVSVTKQKDGKYPVPLDLTLVPSRVPPRLDEEGNELPDIDDFGDEASTFTVLLGDAKGVIPVNTAPSVEYVRKSSPGLPREFGAVVLELLLNRVVSSTTGEVRFRRMQDATKSALRSWIFSRSELAPYGASRTDLVQAFDNALDVAFRHKVLQYEGASLTVPLATVGVSREDTDGVRAAVMDILADYIKAESFIAPEDGGGDTPPEDTPPAGGGPGGGPSGGPGGGVPPLPMPEGSVFSPPSPELLASVALPDLVPDEKQRSSIPMKTGPVVHPSQAPAQARGGAPVGSSGGGVLVPGSFVPVAQGGFVAGPVQQSAPQFPAPNQPQFPAQQQQQQQSVPQSPAQTQFPAPAQFPAQPQFPAPAQQDPWEGWVPAGDVAPNWP